MKSRLYFFCKGAYRANQHKMVEQMVEPRFFVAFSPQKKKAPKPHGFKAFWMVETAGLEPVTSTMRMSRSPR